MVVINKTVNNVPYVKTVPSKRAMNIVAIDKNMAPPFVFRLTPSVRTKVEMRLSFFILLFMQCNVVGSVTALQKKNRFFFQYICWVTSIRLSYDEAAAKAVIHGSINLIKKLYGCFRKKMK